MQDHSSATVFHPAADLDRAQAEGVHLDPGQGSTLQPAAQPLEDGVSRRVQEQSELVGDEPTAGETIGLEGSLEVLDVQLSLAAGSP